jgi:hypothetical protein
VDEPPTFQPLWPAAGGETATTAATADLPAAAGEEIEPLVPRRRPEVCFDLLGE